MKTIGMVIDSRNPKAKKMAYEVADWLKKKGNKVFVRLNERILENNYIDMVITFGGDGTVLRAANLVVDKKTPIARVNFGTEGYLTNTEPGEVYKKLIRVLDAKDYSNHKRTRLEVEVYAPGIEEPILKKDFLNEIAIERSDIRVISCWVMVNGKKYYFVGDAFVLAPRTGSTAYQESAGGQAETREDRVVFKVVASSLRNGNDRLKGSIRQTFIIKDITGKARLNIDGKKILKKVDGLMFKVKKSKRYTIFMEIGDAPRMRGD